MEGDETQGIFFGRLLSSRPTVTAGRESWQTSARRLYGEWTSLVGISLIPTHCSPNHTASIDLSLSVQVFVLVL